MSIFQDVAAVSFDGNKLSWFRNDGSLDLAEVPISSSYAGPRTVVAADWDREGPWPPGSASRESCLNTIR